MTSSIRPCASLPWRFFILIMALWLLPGWVRAQDKTSGPWVMQSSRTKAGLRGIHAVGGGVAWASGTNGTVLRTEDGGYMWQSCAMPPGAEKLDFRGVWAWDANTAIVMSSGPGDQSRLYKTTDGCSSWTLLYTNPDKDGFWDAMVFGNRKEGAILGDPVKGRFAIFLTFDSGATWERSLVPGPQPDPGGEAAFAASNSSLCVNCFYARRAFVTGGVGGPHIFVFYSGPTDSGPIDKKQLPWSSGWSELLGSPVVLAMRPELKALHYPSGASSGLFSLTYALRSTNSHPMLVAVGGDYAHPDSPGAAVYCDLAIVGCQVAVKPPHGYRSAVAWDADAKAWIAVGTNGSDVSYDDGKTWSPLDSAPGGGKWNALSLPWVVGPEGRIAKLGSLPPRK